MMVNMSTNSYSTAILSMDVQNASEYVTDSNVLDTSESMEAAVDLQSLIFSTVFSVVIILANIISLAAFLIEKRLRTYNNYLIINLTILDLLVGIGLALYLEHSYLGYYPFSQNACKIITGIFKGIVNASNITVIVICADRHQAVYDPINHFISRTKRKAVIINCIPWVIGLSFWIGFLTIWEIIIDYDTGPDCVHIYLLSPLTNMIQSSFMFYLPLLVIAVLYIRIFIKIRKTVGGRMFKKSPELKDVHLSSLSVNVTDETTCEGVASESNSTSFSDITHVTEKGSENKKAVESLPGAYKMETTVQAFGLPTSTSHRVESTSEMRKATRTLLFIVIAFLLAWIPVSVINLIFSIDPFLIFAPGGLPPAAFTIFLNLQYGNSLFNPISYTMSQPLFRTTVFRMFSCKRGS